jgi:transcription termination/antitermination protein NusA
VGNIIVGLGKTEAVILRTEQGRGEKYSQDERIRAVIKNVHRNPTGPQIELSRTAPELLIRTLRNGGA